MGSTYLSNFLFSSFTWCGIGTVLSCSYFYYHISFLSPYIYRFYVTYLYIPRHRLHTIFSLTIFPSTCPTIHLLSLSLHHPLPTSVSISFPSSHYLSGSVFPFPFACTRTEVFVPSPPRSLMCYSPYSPSLFGVTSLHSLSLSASSVYPLSLSLSCFFIIHSAFSAASSVCCVTM